MELLKQRENRTLTMKFFWIILTTLICIRIGMYVGMLLGIPETYGHKGWYLHHGGDQLSYITFAQKLSQLTLEDSHRTLGYPLFLVPFMWIFGNTGFEDIMIPVTIFQACVLFPISILLVALISKKMTRNHYIALITAALWTLWPYILKLSADLAIRLSTHNPEMLQARLIQTQVWMVHQIWAQVLSDSVSCFLIICCMYIFILSLQSSRNIFPVVLGILSATAFLVRPQEAMFAVVVFLIYMVWKDLKNGLIFCLSFGITIVPQIFYNVMIKGYTLFGYSSVIQEQYQVDFQRIQTQDSLEMLRVASDAETLPVISLQYALNVLKIMISKVPIALSIFTGLLFILMGIIAFIRISRIHKAYATFFIGWTVAYSLFLASYAHFYMDMPRLLMSVTPFYLMGISIVIQTGIQWLLNHRA